MSLVFHFILADNLAAKNMTNDQYISALESDKFQGYDIGLCVLSEATENDNWSVEQSACVAFLTQHKCV